MNTTEGSGNKEVCYHACFNFPAFVQVFGPKGWHKFVPLYEKFSKLADVRIKKTLAASIHELARILGPTFTEKDLLPVMEKLFKERE